MKRLIICCVVSFILVAGVTELYCQEPDSTAIDSAQVEEATPDTTWVGPEKPREITDAERIAIIGAFVQVCYDRDLRFTIEQEGKDYWYTITETAFGLHVQIKGRGKSWREAVRGLLVSLSRLGG